jgi:hypothetical protein
MGWTEKFKSSSGFCFLKPIRSKAPIIVAMMLRCVPETFGCFSGRKADHRELAVLYMNRRPLGLTIAKTRVGKIIRIA